MKVRTVCAFCPAACRIAAGVAKGGRILERRSGDLLDCPPGKRQPAAFSTEEAVYWR